MLSPISPDKIVTGLVFISELCENAAKDLDESVNNVICALGKLNVEIEESDVKTIICYDRLSLDDIRLLNHDYCSPSVYVLGVIGSYRDFKENTCELVLRPINE